MRRRVIYCILIGLFLIVTSQVALGQEDASQTADAYILSTRVGRGKVEKLQFSADNERLAVMTTRGIWLYAANQLDSTAPALFAPEGLDTSDPKNMAITEDFTRVAGLNQNGNVTVWTTDKGELLYQFPDIRFDFVRLAFNRTGAYLAAINPKEWIIWDMFDGSVHQTGFTMLGGTVSISGFAFSETGEELGFEAYSPGADIFFRYYRFVDADTGILSDSIDLYEPPFIDVLQDRLNPQSLLVVNYSWRNSETRDYMLDVVKRDPGYDGWKHVTYIPSGYSTYTFSPDNTRMAVVTGDILRVWNIEQAMVDPPCALPDHANPAELTPCDGSWRALVSETDAHAAQVLDDPYQTTTLIGRDQYRSTDAQWSITAQLDQPRNQRFVELNHIDGRQFHLTIPENLTLGTGASSVIITGNRIIIVWSGAHDRYFVGEGQILAWDIGSGETTDIEPTRIVGAHGDNDITAVALSPDQSRFATSSTDKTIRIWDSSTLSEVVILQYDDIIFKEITFADDGETILALGEDDVVYFWTPSR